MHVQNQRNLAVWKNPQYNTGEREQSIDTHFSLEATKRAVQSVHLP